MPLYARDEDIHAGTPLETSKYNGSPGYCCGYVCQHILDSMVYGMFPSCHSNLHMLTYHATYRRVDQLSLFPRHFNNRLSIALRLPAVRNKRCKEKRILAKKIKTKKMERSGSKSSIPVGYGLLRYACAPPLAQGTQHTHARKRRCIW